MRLFHAVFLVLALGIILAGQPARCGSTQGTDTPIRDREPLPPGALVRVGTMIPQNGNPVFAVVFSADGKTLASASQDGTVHILEAATGKELRHLQGHQGYVKSIVFSADGKQLVSGGEDKTIRLWDVTTGKELRQFQGHLDAITSVALSPDGKTLASASKDKTVRLWEMTSGKELRQLQGHRNTVRALAFSPDGKILASGGADRTVRFWEASTGKELQPPGLHYGWVYAVAFSLDGKVLAAVGRDQMIHLWDVATGERLRVLGGYQGPLETTVLSADNKMVIAAGQDRIIRLWEVASGKVRQQFAGHQGPVYSLVVAPDGRTLASASGDGTVVLWDLDGQWKNWRPRWMQLSAEERNFLWGDLASAEAPIAYQAIGKLAAEPKHAVPFLTERLQPIFRVLIRTNQLVTELDDDHFAVRQKATRELEKMSELGAPVLRQVLQGRPSLEVRRRVERILEQLEKRRGTDFPSDWLRVLRTIEVLEKIGNAEARQVLESLVRQVPELQLAREARASLERLAKRPAPSP
jgi:hypothetical protein